MSFITRQKHKKSDDSFRLNYQRHGKRCQLYLSNDYTMEDAETVQAMVDHLLRCETTGTEPASYMYRFHLSSFVDPASNTPFSEGKRGTEWKISNIGCKNHGSNIWPRICGID